VIALTASVLAEDKHAAMAAGMQGFASKPVDFAALCLEIATVLQLDIASPLTSAAVAEPSSSALLNQNKALQLWGQWSVYLPALQQFLQQQQPLLQQACDWLPQGNYQALQQLAHAIKGSSGNLALEPFSKVSAELEQAARQQQPQRCQQLLEKMLHCWTLLHAHYQQLAQLHAQTTDPALSVSATALADVLQQLAPLVAQHQLDDPMLELLAQYQGPWHPQVQLLLDSLNDFDFLQGGQLLLKLQQQLQHESANFASGQRGRDAH